MLKGVEELADAVKVTMGPKVTEWIVICFLVYLDGEDYYYFILISNGKGKVLELGRNDTMRMILIADLRCL